MALAAPVLSLSLNHTDTGANNYYDLSWPVVAGANQYKIYSDGVRINTVTASSTSIGTPNLGRNSRRQIQVTAVNTSTSEESAFSNAVYPVEPPVAPVSNWWSLTYTSGYVPSFPDSWTLSSTGTTTATITIYGTYNPNYWTYFGTGIPGGSLPVTIEIYAAKYVFTGGGYTYVPDTILLASAAYVYGTNTTITLNLPSCSETVCFVSSTNGYAGNIAEASSGSQYYKAVLQTKPIAPVSVSVVQTGARSATVTWPASASSSIQTIYYSLFDNGIQIVSYDSISTTNTWNLENIPIGNHSYSVVAWYFTPAPSYAAVPSINSPSIALTILPNSPTNATISGKTPTSITLSWTASTDSVDGYNVYNGIEKKNTTGVIASSSYTITGLNPGMLYSALSIKATKSGIESLPLNVAGVYTYSNLITNPITNGIIATSATVSWSLATGSVAGYNVYNGLTKQNTTMIGPATSTFNLTVVPNTIYSSIKIKTVNAGGEENDGVIVPSFCSLASVPVITSLFDILTNSCQIQWSATGTTNGFQIFNNTTLLASPSAGQTSATLSGLTPNTRYSQINIKSINSQGTASAPSANVAAFWTLASQPTTHATPLLTKTDIVAIVQWTGSGASKYNVYHGTTKKNVSDITGTSFSVTGLIGNTTYNNISVRAVNGDNIENSISPLIISSFTTLATQPTQHASPIINIAPFSANVQWNSGNARYNIYYGANKQNASPVTGAIFNLNTLPSNVQITGVTIRAVNDANEENTITPLAIPAFYTLAVQPTAHATPTITRTTNGATIQWTISNATGYNIYIGATKFNAAPVTGTSNAITGLISNTNYANITVRATNQIGIENAISPLSIAAFWTLANPPTSPQLTSTANTSAVIAWTTPLGSVAGFRIKKGNIIISTTPAILLAGATTCEILGLTPNTTQPDIRILSLNGSSPQDENGITVSTFKTKCSTPTSMQLVQAGTNSATISWNVVPGESNPTNFKIKVNGVVRSGLTITQQ